ncbi:hypothetical protein BT96DRAFT_914096 [Gymnopus androsaceus JB14]|uniref:DUF2433 domain-containing protein n=1 Tax=Gymnopus androsaceus JB14 TaxID=1447944 RepID=A0A6A4IG93_9AGAR|nr:hypothetical protein BT96DRAFT_914096 [Gymnopus androsaceus JB14]
MVNTTTQTFDTVHGRILCIADIRGRLSSINDLARQVNAVAVIHTGDFGFFESNSLSRINDRTLRHLTMYSPLIPNAQRTHLLNTATSLRSTVDISLLSEFPLLLSGNLRLSIPVYTVWGACEDVLILEKFRSKGYSIPNLHIIDEATTHLLDLGGVKLRLLGLGGAVVLHKMFDNGDGNATIAGGQGTMWTTTLQLGELVDTAQRVYDPSETRLLITHASPGREGLISQLALVCKADLTISAGLHFRYSSSWNEFSVLADYEGFRTKLLASKESFDKVWESVKTQVDQVVDENQRVLLDKALNVIERIPPPLGAAPTTAAAAQDEPAWKNCWNWNLCDAAYGSLVLDIREGRVNAELKSQGFNYAYRRSATVPPTPTSTNANKPFPAPGPPSKPITPAPGPAASKPVTPAPVLKASSPSPAPSKPTTPAPAPSIKATDRAIPPHLASKPTSGTGTPSLSDAASATGSGTTKDNKDKEKDAAAAKLEKAEREKQKKKEKKERKDKEREKEKAAGAETPNPDDLKSPASATGTLGSGTGTRTPKSAAGGGPAGPNTKPKDRERNPYTIFMRMSVPTNESELREFYAKGVEASGITKIHFPSTTGAGRAQKLAYVEFVDEESMRRGLERGRTGETLNGATPDIKQATDRETRERERAASSASHAVTSPVVAPTGSILPSSPNPNQSQSGSGHNQNQSHSSSGHPGQERSQGSFRGRGGRGGGGFASRGLAAAGLTRGGGPGGAGATGGNANATGAGKGGA